MRSGLSLSFSQPLLRDFRTDRRPREPRSRAAPTGRSPTPGCRRASSSTTAAVKTAYWNLVAARANVEARQARCELAEELVRVNKAKVDVGQSPPIDLVSAQAEVASNQEQLIVAETAVKQAEDRLRLLIFDAAQPRHLERAARADRLAAGRRSAAIDVDAAVTNALRDRADLDARAQGHRERPDVAAACRQPEAARCPGQRQLSGERPRRHRGAAHRRLPGHHRRPGQRDRLRHRCSISCSRSNYPTWAVGRQRVVSASARAPRKRTMRAAELEAQQAEQRVKSAEARVIQQVRDAALEGGDERAGASRPRAPRGSSPSSGSTPSRSASRSACRPASW